MAIAAILKEGTGRGNVITLNPDPTEVKIANENLRHYTRLKILRLHSHVYLGEIAGEVDEPVYDMIFVDGDHNNIHLDLPFWNYLRPGGLMIFHDYSPAGSWRACVPVWQTLNYLRDNILKRDFDILVADEQGVGIAGWYKRKWEVMPAFDDKLWAL